MRLKKDLRAVAVLAGVAFSHSLFAQTGPVCGSKLGSFLIEQPVDVTTIQSTLKAALPSAVTTAIASGASEIRSRTTYNVATGVLNNDLFVVSKGSLNPTPSSFDIVGQRFGYLVVNIDQVTAACQPAPAVLLSGTILDGAPIFADPTSAPYAFSFSYNIPPTPSNGLVPRGPTTVRDVVSDGAGLNVVYQGTAVATVNFIDPPAGSTTPMILTSIPPFGGSPLKVADNPYQIDASSSFDPTGLSLTYLWSSDKTATFFPSNTSPIPVITFNGGKGTYNITLTVTSEYGATATSKFTLTH